MNLGECDHRNDPVVWRFLRGRTSLIDLLRDVPTKAREFFGDDAGVCLEIVHDGFYFVDPELFVFVSTTLSADDAFKCMLKMEEEWWLDADVPLDVVLDVRLVEEKEN